MNIQAYLKVEGRNEVGYLMRLVRFRTATANYRKGDQLRMSKIIVELC